MTPSSGAALLLSLVLAAAAQAGGSQIQFLFYQNMLATLQNYISQSVKRNIR
jgi:hypothetical protein